MNESGEHYGLWVEKYRPQTIKDCILPPRLKEKISNIVESQFIPNMLFSGHRGTGKTSMALALAEELGYTTMVVNGSDEGRLINTLREKITPFCSSVSLSNKRKLLVIDEADYLNCFGKDQKLVTIDESGIDHIHTFHELNGKTVTVYSYNFETHCLEPTKAKIFKSGFKEIYNVYLSNNTILNCTEDHPFFDTQGKERFFTEGSVSYLNRLGQLGELDVVRYLSAGMGEVYDITVESSNSNFLLVNGVIAHNCDSVQPALRNYIEKFSKNCSFIFTCNYKNKLIPELHSRFQELDFDISKSEKMSIAIEFLQRLKFILQTEEIQYDSKLLSEIMMRHLPDMRKVINELQGHSGQGQLNSNILLNKSSQSINELFSLMKEKDFKKLREWVHEQSDLNLFTEIALYGSKYFEHGSLPPMILILNDHQYKHAFVLDKEINFIACIVNLMSDCDMK